MDERDANRLRKIRDKGGRADLKTASLSKATVAPYEASGQLRLVMEGRKALVELTDAGRQALETFDAQPKTEKRAPAPRGPTLATISDKLVEIIDRLARIEAALPLSAKAKPEVHDRAWDLPFVKTLLLETVAELDATRRYGGLVPIPEIRKQIRSHKIPDDTVTAALVDLEKEYAIDLNIAQASTEVPDRGAGIERPGRGLLYYVARRSA